MYRHERENLVPARHRFRSLRLLSALALLTEKNLRAGPSDPQFLIDKQASHFIIS